MIAELVARPEPVGVEQLGQLREQRPALGAVAEELVAHLPSWMSDPVRACPATTLFRSVQVHGTLLAVEDLALKARALEALMQRWQPEGRYHPIDAADPLYRGELEGLIARLERRLAAAGQMSKLAAE